jgi:hypothetical protein
MAKTFRNYDAFKSVMSPGVSKVDFQNFLQKITTEKKVHDSNMGHTLDVHRKILAYRQKEQQTRANTLCANLDQAHAQNVTGGVIRN